LEFLGRITHQDSEIILPMCSTMPAVFTIALAGGGESAINYAFREVAVSPTPEPEAWASMALGLGLAGWVARRRKAKLAAAA
jgi:hypothetical protein